MILKKMDDEQAFDAFVEAHPYAHYMKTSMWGHNQEHTKGYTCTMLGFMEDDKLTGTAMVLRGRSVGHPFLYIPKGPCIDYTDEKTVREAFSLLKEYAEKEKVHFLRVDPNVLRMEKDISGNVVEGGENNENITVLLTDLGFMHKRYGYAYDGSWANRFTLTVDISDDFPAVRSRFAKKKITALNRHKANCVTTRMGTRQDLERLMKLEEQLAEQKGFMPHSRAFFEDILDCFGENAAVYVTEVNLAGMKAGIEKELSGKKYAKDPEARAAKEKQLEQAEAWRREDGDLVGIACGIFVRTGDTSYDLYTYNHKSYLNLNPIDSMHVYAMQDMQKKGVKTYDLCGFSGVTTKDDPEYGLYDYKKTFGSRFVEQIGEFDYPVKPAAWKRFITEKKAEVRIRRKFWSIKYKKK